MVQWYDLPTYKSLSLSLDCCTRAIRHHVMRLHCMLMSFMLFGYLSEVLVCLVYNDDYTPSGHAFPFHFVF